MTRRMRYLVGVAVWVGIGVVVPAASQPVRDKVLTENPYRSPGGSCIYGAKGQLVYAPPGAGNGDRFRELALAIRRWALTFQASSNLVVVTTPRGYATPLADAIDAAGHPDVIGTVAGENTIFVVAREGLAGSELSETLRTYTMEGAA